MKIRLLMVTALVAIALMSTGCMGVATPAMGVLITDTKFGGVEGMQGGSKEGKACASSVLALLATGDASVQAAAKDGGITNVKSIRHEANWTLIFGEYCTVVSGD